MSGRARLGWGLLLLAVVAVAWLAGAAAGPRRGPSTRSTAPDGYRALAAYLEARGVEVVRWEDRLARLDAPGTLVIADSPVVPWTPDEIDAVRTRLRRRQPVVILVAGRESTSPLLDAFSVAMEPNPEALPSDWRPWTWGDAGRTLSGAEGPGLRVRRAPYRAVGGRVADARWIAADAAAEGFVTRWPGELWVVPASAWSNAWLGEGENLAALEAAVAALGGPWIFDDFHQGMRPVVEAEVASIRGVLLGVLGQLVLLYLLAAWALSRRSGPVRPPAPPRPPVVVGELRALAALHRRAGHASEAGRWLLAEARRLARGDAGRWPEGFAGGERVLLTLARRVGEAQAAWSGRRTPR